MMAGFVIWSIVGLVLLGIGIQAWRSKRAVGFYAGIKPPKVSDVRKYNRATAILWFAYAALFELLGLPLLFLQQNASGFLWTIPGVAAISVLLPVAYSRILHRFEQR